MKTTVLVCLGPRMASASRDPQSKSGKMRWFGRLRKHRIRLLAATCVFGWFVGGAWAQAIGITGEVNPAMAPFDDLITSLMQKYAIPGGQLAVTQNGKLVLAHGYTGLRNDAAVQPDSLFRIASLTKQLTSIAVLQLVQQGKLSLDDRPFAILADIQPLLGAAEDPRLATITIRHLLQHSGGWDRDSTGYDPMFDSLHIASVAGVLSPPSTRDIIRYMRGRALDFTPGTRYVYSNFGYAVLGRVIEKITGASYEQYVRSNVLAPVGVNDMQIGQTLIAGRQPGEVMYYMEPGTAPVQSVFASSPGSLPWPYGGFCLEAMDSHGGWLASAIDLLKFWNGIDGRRGNALLTPASVQLMTARPSIPDWSSTSYWYGMGFLIRPSGGDNNWWHDGSLPGTRTWTVRTYNGYAWAALFNQRMNDSTMDSQFVTDLDNGLWSASAAVKSWPATDQFSSYPKNSNPLSLLSALAPANAAAGGPGFTLTVTGSGFVQASTVQWNGANRPTAFVSSTQLTAAISTTDISTLGTAPVTVANPLPGGGISAPLKFTVTSNPVPSLTNLTPATVAAGGPAFTLTLTGSGFVQSSVALWNGNSRPTTFINTTQLSAAISIADISTAGSNQVTVNNPSPGGGMSPAMKFAVMGPVQTGPVITSVQDAESTLKTVVSGEWIAIYGTNLANTSRSWGTAGFSDNNLPTALSGVSVKFNGLPAAVYYISPAQLNVQAPAGLAGAVSVTATNNGATSAAFNVTAAQNAPSLFNYAAGSSVYPAAVHADGVLIGNPAFTVGARMAVPSETIILFVNGLAAAPSGTLIGAPIPYPNPVTVTIGSVDAPVGYAGLVSPGQYQLNVKVPAALAPGDHPIVVSTAGVTSPAGITLPVGQ